MPDVVEKLPLVKVIEELNDQLREAEKAAAESKKPSVLSLKECTVELAMSWEKRGDGGVDFWVIKLGGDISRAETQTVTLTMVPPQSRNAHSIDVELPGQADLPPEQ